MFNKVRSLGNEASGKENLIKLRASSLTNNVLCYLMFHLCTAYM